MDNIDDLDSRYLHLEDVLTKASEQIEPYIQTWIKNLTDSIFVICRIVKNLILGLLVAVYLILNKEMLRSQFRVLFKRILKEKTYEVLHSFLMKLNQIFLDFIIGKTADSLIVFILSYITFLIAGMPSPLLISTIVGITNIIPCFGPFIGAIPSAIIVFMQEPSKLVLFIILIVIIQQIDGNIIGVKILGNKLNLPSVWVFFSILIFGSLFGVWGMIIGVPTFAVLYTTLKEFLNIKTKKDENV
jgi:predicted PurR-regulated permease PerM